MMKAIVKKESSDASNDYYDGFNDVSLIQTQSSNDGSIESQKSKDSEDQCNLIVNYLPQEITDRHFHELFAGHGTILTSKVIRIKGSKKSLGYGFILYQKEDQAREAIELKNGYKLGDKTLKVSYARPASDDIRNCKLYCTNLPRTYDDEKIRQLFNQYGEIIECRILKNQYTRENKGVAFIQFANRQQANAALDLHGTIIPGAERCLSIKYAEGHHRKDSFGNDNNLRTLNINGGGYDNNSNGKYNSKNKKDHYKQLYDHDKGGLDLNSYQDFSTMNHQYPTTMEEYHHQNIRWMQAAQGMNAYQMQRLYAQQQAQQMGFVEQQQQFVSSPHGHTSPHSLLNNRVMNTSQAPGTVFMVQPQATKGEYAGNVTLTINGLPRNADVGLLHDLFAPYGRIHNAFIDQDEDLHGIDGCSRGSVVIEGIVRAQHALHAMHGAVLYEGSVPLMVTISNIS